MEPIFSFFMTDNDLMSKVLIGGYDIQKYAFEGATE